MPNAIEEYRKRFGTKTKTSNAIDEYRKRLSTQRPTSAIQQFRAKNDLKTSTGLYNTAVRSGLKNDADRIVESQKGESNQIFSGGMFTDILDGLNTLDYGVVGLLKGKTFSEGVKNRESFTDKDALGGKGFAGAVGGTLLDIAVDPLTYVAPWTVLKKVPFLSKLAKAGKEAMFGKLVTKGIEGTEKTYQAVEGGTDIGKYLANKFVWMFGKDPIFKDTFERSVKNQAVSGKLISDLGKNIASLNPETAAKILIKDSTGRFKMRNLTDLEGILKPDELESISTLRNTIDSLGKEAVDLGILSKTKYEENIGEYIKNAYNEYELAKGKGLFGSKKVGVSGIKSRVEGLTPEKMKELGQIDNPAYLMFKSAFDLMKDVENGKLLKEIGDKFGANTAQEGFELVKNTPKWGKLAGKYIPKDMADYLNEIIEPSKQGLGKDLIANFKFFKVIMNPATHARNIISNKILNYWKLGMNPLDPRVLNTERIALGEVRKGTGKWIKEATPHGYNIDTFASAEMKNLLDSPEANLWGKGQKGWQSVKKKLGDLYQSEENQAKLSAYIYNRTIKKLEPENAWKAAESATFNYAQVTPFIRKLRESLFGFPFITFTAKATPNAIETAFKHPQRIGVIGKIKQAIENQSDLKETERERASEPSWIKDGLYVKLPMKDKNGRSAYFDLTYIIPFGDLVGGNFFERQTNSKTGLPESRVSALAKNSPFFQVISGITKNQDFFGHKIWLESDPESKQLKDLFTYLTKTYAPPLLADQLPGGYNNKGERQKRGFKGATGEDQKRNLSQEILKNVGIKIQPIDVDIQESYQDYNTRRGLEKLLTERGILSEFKQLYKPK